MIAVILYVKKGFYNVICEKKQIVFEFSWFKVCLLIFR